MADKTYAEKLVEARETAQIKRLVARDAIACDISDLEDKELMRQKQRLADASAVRQARSAVVAAATTYSDRQAMRERQARDMATLGERIRAEAVVAAEAVEAAVATVASAKLS